MSETEGTEYLPTWTYMFGGPRPAHDQDDQEPDAPPLTAEKAARRTELSARVRDANRTSRKRCELPRLPLR